jgi:hypothetical protein
MQCRGVWLFVTKIGHTSCQVDVPLSAPPSASGHVLTFTRCVGMAPLLCFSECPSVLTFTRCGGTRNGTLALFW